MPHDVLLVTDPGGGGVIGGSSESSRIGSKGGKYWGAKNSAVPRKPNLGFGSVGGHGHDLEDNVEEGQEG